MMTDEEKTKYRAERQRLRQARHAERQADADLEPGRTDLAVARIWPKHLGDPLSRSAKAPAVGPPCEYLIIPGPERHSVRLNWRHPLAIPVFIVLTLLSPVMLVLGVFDKITGRH